MGLLDDVSSSIEDVLDDLFDDESLVRPVTYRKFLSRSYDDTVGYNVAQYDDRQLDAVRLRHTTETAKMENSTVEVGDWYYMFRASDMPSGVSLSDVITDNGTELTVKGINDGFNFVYLVTVSGLGL